MNIDTDDEDEDDENNISIDFVRDLDHMDSTNIAQTKTEVDLVEDQIMSNMMN